MSQRIMVDTHDLRRHACGPAGVSAPFFDSQLVSRLLIRRKQEWVPFVCGFLLIAGVVFDQENGWRRL